jgi:hypothetical protein
MPSLKLRQAQEAQSQENKIWLFFAKADFFSSAKMHRKGASALTRQ